MSEDDLSLGRVELLGLPFDHCLAKSAEGGGVALVICHHSFHWVLLPCLIQLSLHLFFHPLNAIHSQVNPLIEPTEQLPVEVCKQTPLLLMYKVFHFVLQAPPLELDSNHFVCMNVWVVFLIYKFLLPVGAQGFSACFDRFKFCWVFLYLEILSKYLVLICSVYIYGFHMFSCLRFQFMHILLGAKIWFVPGFNFNKKVFFHVLICNNSSAIRVGE